MRQCRDASQLTRTHHNTQNVLTKPTQLDRQLHLGHRRRRAARSLCTRQIPRCNPADGRTSTPRCGARTDQESRTRKQEVARPSQNFQPGPGTSAGCGASLLQHLEVHPARPQKPGQATSLESGFRSLAGRFLRQRAGNSRQLRIPQPNPALVQSRCARHADRKTPVAGYQSGPRPGTQRR